MSGLKANDAAQIDLRGKQQLCGELEIQVDVLLASPASTLTVNIPQIS